MASSSSGAGIPRHYGVSELKSRFLHLAQTSVYHVKFATPPEVNDFVSKSGRGVSSFDISNIELLCSEASLPGSTLATHEVTGDYPGVTEKMAYRRIYDESLDLTFYVDADYNVVEYLDGWMNFITGQGAVSGKPNESFKDPTQSYRMLYPNQYKGKIFLVKYEKDVTRTFRSMTYTFVDAFPISLVSSPISYNSSEILKFTVSFSYTRYVRERIFVNYNGGNQPNPNAPGNPEIPREYLGPAFANLGNEQILINNGIIRGEGEEIAASQSTALTNFRGERLFPD
jgi:hypothetical protein